MADDTAHRKFRMVDVVMVDSQDFQRLSPKARLLLLTMFVCSSNRHGLVRTGLDELARRTGLSTRQLGKPLAELERAGLIVRGGPHIVLKRWREWMGGHLTKNGDGLLRITKGMAEMVRLERETLTDDAFHVWLGTTGYATSDALFAVLDVRDERGRPKKLISGEGGPAGPADERSCADFVPKSHSNGPKSARFPAEPKKLISKPAEFPGDSEHSRADGNKLLQDENENERKKKCGRSAAPPPPSSTLEAETAGAASIDPTALTERQQGIADHLGHAFGIQFGGAAFSARSGGAYAPHFIKAALFVDGLCPRGVAYTADNYRTAASFVMLLAKKYNDECLPNQDMKPWNLSSPKFLEHVRQAWEALSRISEDDNYQVMLLKWNYWPAPPCEADTIEAGPPDAGGDAVQGDTPAQAANPPPAAGDGQKPRLRPPSKEQRQAALTRERERQGGARIVDDDI